MILKKTVRSFIYRVASYCNRFIKHSIWYRSLLVDPDHQIYPDNVWYREHEERNFDVINLGSSGGKWAFDWDTLGIKGMNWAQQPQTLHDDFRQLKNFHSILRKNGFVLITIMPFSGLDKKIGVMDTFKYLETYYWDVAKEMPYYKEASRLRTFPILFGKPAFKAVVKCVLRREKKIQDWRTTIETNPMSFIQLESDAKQWIMGWSRQFGISDFSAPLTEENRKGRLVRVAIMRQIIDFCSERGYRPFYVIPPVTTHLSRYFTSEFKKIYINDFLREVNRDIEFLDYMDSESFKDDSLYFNSFFLNGRGRKLFTAQVWKDINKCASES